MADIEADVVRLWTTKGAFPTLSPGDKYKTTGYDPTLKLLMMKDDNTDTIASEWSDDTLQCLLAGAQNVTGVKTFTNGAVINSSLSVNTRGRLNSLRLSKDLAQPDNGGADEANAGTVTLDDEATILFDPSTSSKNYYNIAVAAAGTFVILKNTSLFTVFAGAAADSSTGSSIIVPANSSVWIISDGSQWWHKGADIVSADSVAELRLIDGTNLKVIELLGYNTPGDGSGDVFYWIDGLATADNGGTIFGALSTGRWVRKYNGTNVLDYAKPEWWGPNTTPGTTDMTSQINSALAAASNVVLSYGDYLISSSINISAGERLKVNQGAKLTAASAVVIMVNGGGTLEAGLYQIFDTTYDASYVNTNVDVTLAAGSCEAAYPQWWGGAGDDSTDNTGPIQSAIDSGCDLIRLTDGTWQIGGTIKLNRPDINLVGNGRVSTKLAPAAANIAIGAGPNAIFQCTSNVMNGTIRSLRFPPGTGFTGNVFHCIEGTLGSQAIFSMNFYDFWIDLGTLAGSIFNGGMADCHIHHCQIENMKSIFNFNGAGVGNNIISDMLINDCFDPVISTTTGSGTGARLIVNNIHITEHKRGFAFDLKHSSDIIISNVYIDTNPDGNSNDIGIMQLEDCDDITLTNAQIRHSDAEVGTHTAGTSATVMTDSTANFSVDALIGYTIINSKDGSKGAITDNTSTTITVTALAGGFDNQWETGDTYRVVSGNLQGLYINNSSAKISALWIEDVIEALKYPVYLTGSGNDVVIDNMNVTGAANKQIALDSAGGRLLVSNSYFNKSAKSIVGNLGTETIDLVFNNNRMLNAGYNGGSDNVFDFATSGDVRFTNNIIGSDDTNSNPAYIWRLTGSGRVFVQNNHFPSIDTWTGFVSPGNTQEIIRTGNFKYSGNVAAGAHDAATSATILTDSGKAWTVDEFIGFRVFNTADGSQGLITGNTATTITVSALTGGTNNEFQNGDTYVVGIMEEWLHIVNHDYSAGTTDWILDEDEYTCNYITVTNAGGAANAILPRAMNGKIYTVYNNSGQTITFKVTGGSGAAVADSATVLLGVANGDIFAV